jgi:hypothetical protein
MTLRFGLGEPVSRSGEAAENARDFLSELYA